MKDEVKLTEGSRLRITLLENADRPIVMEGLFRGYMRLGDDYALHLEVEQRGEAGKNGKKGKKKTMRLIPISGIQFIDVLRLAPEKKKAKKKNEIDDTLYS